MPRGDHHRAHIALAQLRFQGLHAHAPVVVGGDAGVVDFEHAGDALMGVVRLPGADDAAARSTLIGHPERFEVGDGAAGSQMAQKLRPAEHGGDGAHGFNLHLRTGPAAVARMVVGVDGHGQRISRPCHRMRRLEHLPGIERMEVRVVIAEPAAVASKTCSMAAVSTGES